MQREPILNVPRVLVALIAAFVVVHIGREWILSPEDEDAVDRLFAFNPMRYAPTLLPGGDLPGGWPAGIWSFVSYAFIHASWTHLGVNAIWFLPFGSAVARRFGSFRFLLFFAATAAGGALAHLFTHGGQDVWVVGASGSVAGMMAAAMRFAFQRGGPLSLWGGHDDAAYRVPAIPLSGVLHDTRILIFLIVWFAINLLFGLMSLPLGATDQPVAWEAHVGGFLVGLLLFGMFDPPPRPEDDPDAVHS